MTRVVISQPMFFPWVGFFEQLQLADRYVIYDTAAFSKGSFTNRVQIPVVGETCKWLTLPLVKFPLGTPIQSLQLRPEVEWMPRHQAFLEQVYQKAPFKKDMLALVQEVYAQSTAFAMPLILKSMQVVCDYYDLAFQPLYASELLLETVADKSGKVLQMVQACKGTVYITGSGALNYLDHQRFEEQQIQVRYMDYAKKAYPQLTTDTFNPYVSILDLIANVGPEGKAFFAPKTIDWKMIDAS